MFCKKSKKKILLFKKKIAACSNGKSVLYQTIIRSVKTKISPD